jgi:hypothetical protein
VEIGKNNRIEQTPIHDLNLPANPHGYWLFGNLDFQSGNMISSRSRYDLFDSPPYISTVFRALRKCKKNTQEQYEILKFDPAKTLINQGFSAEKTARANAHFECRTFDLSDNSPYISSVILAPEECKKNTQERYEIVKSEPAQSPVRRTFSADETAGASKNFECGPFNRLGTSPYISVCF